MYPPEQTASAEEGVRNLLSSLRRTADNWTGEVRQRVDERGRACFALYLYASTPTAVKKTLTEYVTGYMRSSGWQLACVRVKKRYVELVVAKA
jgi:hypothetical protein